MGTNFIEKLRREGSLVLYHDYRMGHCNDLSGFGNHGVPSAAVRFNRNGIEFNTTAVVTVNDALNLRLTEGSIVVFADFNKQPTNGRMVSKRDAGGCNYEMTVFGATDVGFVDSNLATKSLAMTIAGNQCVSANFKIGEVPDGYRNGIYIGAFSGAVNIVADDAPLLIGNWYSATLPLQQTISAALIINRKLTATEHSQVYASLSPRS